ncbi:hypothetical protein ACPOLB_02950 [Rubrivivax sp. RP6-9]|uniref:hypothetical protein n=1 Tax=Rubrivivax sp. RP6-9 TaxID=3415750 RepID=UPI003CC5E9E6
MQSKKLVEASPVEADRHLRDPRHRARFSELLNPKETATRIATSFPELVHEGWAIRVELTSEELELLQNDGQAGFLQLDIVHFSLGLPVAVLRAQAGGVEFRFAIPLWLAGAQQWLLDAVDQEQFLLLLDPTDDDFSFALKGFGNLLDDQVSLVSAATLTRELSPTESQEQMYLAGLKLMQDRSLPAPFPGSEPLAVRAAVAGQGKDAVAVMGALMAAETARVAVMGRDEALSL